MSDRLNSEHHPSLVLKPSAKINSMPQITSLRRLLLNHPPPLLTLLKPSSVLPILSKSSRIHQPLRAFSHFRVFCSSSRRRRNSSTPLNFRSRGKASVAERKEGGDKKEIVMEESELPGFNKRRAEGRDKNDMPRKLARNTRKPNPVSTICYVQILGTGLDTQDTSPSVLLFFDQQRFIFNAGEGLQRFCTEHKIKLSKIDHIFLSRVCSETAGGLPGLLLTLAGIGEEGLAVNLWGHSDLNLLIGAMKSFIPNAAMVHTRSFGSSPSSEGNDNSDLKKFTKAIELINDEVVSISAILLRPCYSNVTSLRQQEQMFPGSPEVGLGEDGYQISKSKVLSGEDGTMLKPGDISVIYVCELAEIKGKFYPDKAKALGLRPGPKYRELQLGNSVKSDQQNIMVHPNDVMDPSVPGPIVLLVDCPTLSHFQCLLSADSLNVYYTDNVGNQSENAKTVNCVIHLTPLFVTSTLDYQSWMKRFGGAQHIFAGHEPKNAGIPILKSSARISARLNYLCPQFFPSSGFWPLQGINNLPLKSNHPCEGLHGTSAENLLKFRLRPHKELGVDKSEILTSREHADIIDELLTEIPDIVDAAEAVRQLRPDVHKIEEPWLNDSGLPSCLEDISREDMEIILLGTGSSQPSKYRNVTSIYINLFFKGSMLLDCGEGTLGQLKRRFGVEGADDAVRKLRCIWISHIHADHHTGLARILALRCKLFKGIPHEPILVVGPRQLKRFLDAYQRLEDLDMQFLDCKHTTKASWDNFQSSLESNFGLSLAGDSTDSQNTNMKTNITDIEGTLFAQEGPMQSYWKRPGSPIDHGAAFPILKNLKDVLHEAGLEALMSFPVIHCPQAFGVVLKAAKRTNNVGKVIPGWKLVYSGDTRPCLELVEASRGATVLIHEATFEDGLVEEAIAKNHSTTKEAIEVGDSAGVYRTILTHFSQRYPKIPVFDESHMHNTCVGFDMMSVNMADLPLLPKVLPYLKLLFRNEMGLDESDDVVDAAAAAK